MIRPRADWGARPARRQPSRLPNSVGLAVHWNGPPLGAYSQGDVPRILRDIQRYHQDTKGWADVAYSFLVDRHGGIWEGRGWNARSAANGTNGGNANYLAVFYLGGQGDPFTDAAKTAIRQLVAAHVARGGRPEVTGHSDHIKTTCPGAEIYQWVRSGSPLGAALGPANTPEEDLPLNSTDLGQIDALIARAAGNLHQAVQADIQRAAAAPAAVQIDYDKLADAIVRRVLTPPT